MPDSYRRRTYKGMTAPVRYAMVVLLFAAVAIAGLLCTSYVHFVTFPIAGRNSLEEDQALEENLVMSRHFPLTCSKLKNLPELTCPANYYPTPFHQLLMNPTTSPPPPQTCPDYFRWIAQDLRPWMKTGITRATLMAAKPFADFRLVIKNGRAYVDLYRKAFQTRDVFTLWGFLQLLRRYPGKLPNLDLMFECGDLTVVKKENFSRQVPPPLFRYCGDDVTYNIVFPDWSFWGWSELNIKPWERLRKELKEGNKRTKWGDREPFAYWKGNPNVSWTRGELVECNVSKGQDWNARIYSQDWVKEQKEGYKESNLVDQCVHRYKIFVEGRSWSVSEKYIMACDSPTLFVRPLFHDFFSRSLVPFKHYWPIKDDKEVMCKSIKEAVDWGNSHRKKAETMGKEGSRFILDDLKIDHVYDYMFHVLNEYAKLLKYEPSVPKDAVELCSELMACNADGLKRTFMMDSLVEGPVDSLPCTVPSTFDAIVKRDYKGVKEVEDKVRAYWLRHPKKIGD